MKTTIVVLVATLLFSSQGWAQKSKRAQARNLAQSGVNAYDLGDFEKALALFEQAYGAYPDPDILYSIAQSHRKLGHDEKALETYKAYLRNKPNAADRAEVAEQIEELTTLIESRKRAREKPPEGTRAPIAAEPEALAPVTPSSIADAPAPHDGWYKDYVGWGLVAAGVISIAVGTGMYASASSLESDLANVPESQRNDESDKIQQRRTIGAVGLGIGGALVAGGIIKFVLRRTERESRSTQVSVGPSFVGVAGSF